jgi:hypothetical protein
MPKQSKPFITQILAEGTSIERNAEKVNIEAEAKKLAAKMPTDPNQRQLYVGDLLRQSLSKKLDEDVFKKFVQLTNTYIEVQAATPRAKMIIEKERRLI